MKRNTYIGKTLIAVVLLALSGCTKEFGTVDMTAVVKDNIAKDNANAKSHLANGYVAWDNGDLIKINGATCTLSVDNEAQKASVSGIAKNDNGYRAVFPASIAGSVTYSSYGTITLPAKQTYSASSVTIPMVAHAAAGDNTLPFYAIASLMKITVTGTTTVRSIIVSTDGALLSGTGTVSGADNAPVLTLSSGSKSVILDCGDAGVSVSGSKDFYVVIPAVTNVKFTIKVNTAAYWTYDESATLGGLYQSYTRTQSGTTSLGRSELGVVPFVLASATREPSGMCFGKFTVNSSGKQVRFAMGNLQYNVPSATWSFASQQHTVLTSTNDPVAGTMDLFGWATGDNPTQTSTNVNDYYNTNMTSYSAKDWGHNAISNGGNVEKMWTVLSMDEWQYLLNSRTCENRFSLCNLQDQGSLKCLIIYPDDYVHPAGLSAIGNPNSDANGWSSVNNVKYGKMKAAGAVFLPFAGEREGTTVTILPNDNNHPWTNYWTLNKYSQYTAYAQKIATSGRSGLISEKIYKYVGLPVRLVQVVDD